MSSWEMESEAVQPQPVSADETAEILDYLWKSQAHAHDVVKYTDTKAGFLSVFTVAIVGIVSSQSSSIQFSTALRDWSVLQVAAAGSFISLTLSLVFCVLCVYPRSSGKSTSFDLFSWRAILDVGSPREFVGALSRTTAQERTELLGKSVYFLSALIATKIKWIRYATAQAIIGTILAVLALAAAASKPAGPPSNPPVVQQQ
jgi:Family of unknown function (DUF5706)